MRRISSVLVPVLAYVLIYYSGIVVFQDVFSDRYGALFPVFLAAVFTTPVIFFLYQKIPVVRYEYKKETMAKEGAVICAITAAGLFLNAAVSFWIPKSFLKSYQPEKVLLSGSLVLIIVTNCILVPILEELVFRGIVLGQLLLWIKKPVFLPVFLSALFFGAFHFNPVQFLYGLLMGLLLGFYYERTRHLAGCMIAHGLTNLLVILLF